MSSYILQPSGTLPLSLSRLGNTECSLTPGEDNQLIKFCQKWYLIYETKSWNYIYRLSEQEYSQMVPTELQAFVYIELYYTDVMHAGCLVAA